MSELPAIYRMHQRLRMAPLINTPEANTALKLVMVLDLLPAEDISAGVEVIKHYVREHGLGDIFRPLLGYVDNFWVRSVGARQFSVFRQTHRTNNALESFYRRLRDRIGERPAVWDFHNKMRLVEVDQWMEFLRVRNQVAHVRPRNRAYVRQDNLIHQASVRLEQGLYNVAQFLNAVSHCTDRLMEALGGGRNHAVHGADAVMPPQHQPVLNQAQVAAGEIAAQAPAVALLLDNIFDQGGPAIRRRGRGGARARGRGGARQREVGIQQELLDEEEEINALEMPAIPPAPRRPAPGPVRRGRGVRQRRLALQARQGVEPGPAPAPGPAPVPAPVPAPGPAPAPGPEPVPANPREPGLCTMCLANPASKVAIPCGHLCACADCVVALEELGLHNRCPYCRGIVTGFYTVYVL